MDKYVKFVFDNNSQMPDPEKDILRFSDLHSWYKHLDNFNIAYPLLLRGEEPRYSFDPNFDDKDQLNFHWRIVFEHNLSYYNIVMNDTEEPNNIPDDIIKFMKQFPIYLDNDFCPSNDPKSRFLRHICKKMCENFWDELSKFKS